MSKLFVDEIVHQSSQGSGTITLGASGETITTASGAKFSGITGQNYPAFEVYLSSNQSFTSNTVTKVQFDTEVLDTDSCYDNSTNYRFTPTVAGKYLINLALGCNGGAASRLTSSYAMIYKNGTLNNQSHFNISNTSIFYNTPVVSAIIDMNGSTDYVEAYGNIITSSGSPNFQQDSYSRFLGYRIGA